ncbi:TerD family protein [Streptomyces sp. YIM S03343]
MSNRLEPLIVRHTRRVPAPSGPSGQGDVAARQFDAALMSVGFKLSAELLARLSGLSEGTVVDTAVRTLRTVREMAGDHVRHNVYFVDFPANVPATFDFWTSCLAEALADASSRDTVLAGLRAGVLDLLTLPSYGTYQHTYDELIAAAGDRMTVLHLGADLDTEVTALYLALAGSTTPLGEDGLRDLLSLAEHCAEGPQPESVPVRENLAVVNLARLYLEKDLLLDTVTDVLRLACAVSGGDVTLQEPTRFGTLPRPVRRALLAGLDAVVAAAPAKLADVHAHREPWKRLGERLHPHEYPRWPHAAEVFAVARGEKTARSLESRVEELLAARDVSGAAELLRSAPGRLLRALDRLLRTARTQEDRDAVVAAVEAVAPSVSGRVVLSVREHLHNRGGTAVHGHGAAAFRGRTSVRHLKPARRAGHPSVPRRVFVNRLGRAWVTPDVRPRIPGAERERLIGALDAEVLRRLPVTGRLLVDPDVLDVALPLSGKAVSAGLGVLPRGSVTPVDGELLRFFVYWRQTSERTDFDLSALMLDAGYRTVSWLSYTSLSDVGGVHSGDITDAPDGASEFIELRLGKVRGAFIVPQVDIYSGEGFEEVAESFFGFMLRETEQRGRPFEPRTVRMKSELRGPGRVALPLAFRRGAGGRWQAEWLHLYLKGHPTANQVEGNRVSVATLLRGITERDHLTVRYLVGLMTGGAVESALWDGASVPEEPVTYIGLERPEGLHPQSRVFTPENLRDLIPA